jgi:hypothetical protein
MEKMERAAEQARSIRGWPAIRPVRAMCRGTAACPGGRPQGKISRFDLVCPARLFDDARAGREVGHALPALDGDVSSNDDHGRAPLLAFSVLNQSSTLQPMETPRVRKTRRPSCLLSGSPAALCPRSPTSRPRLLSLTFVPRGKRYPRKCSAPLIRTYEAPTETCRRIQPERSGPNRQSAPWTTAIPVSWLLTSVSGGWQPPAPPLRRRL